MFPSLLLVLSSIILSVQGHNHEIAFLYDVSQSVSPSECRTQINGILSYYKTYHEMNVGNVLSFITYSDTSIDIITHFVDEFKKDISLDDLVKRIKAATCNYMDYDETTNKKNGGDAYLAIKTVINSMFGQKNKYYKNNKTPRILLLNNYRSTKSSDIDICSYYYSYLAKHGDMDMSVTVVNFKSRNYLRCLSGDNTRNAGKTYIDFVDSIHDLKTDKFAFYKDDIIYGICGCGNVGKPCDSDFECCQGLECDDGRCESDGDDDGDDDGRVDDEDDDDDDDDGDDESSDSDSDSSDEATHGNNDNNDYEGGRGEIGANLDAENTDNFGVALASEGNIDHNITISLSTSSLGNLWGLVIGFMLVNITLIFCYYQQQKQAIYASQNEGNPAP